MDRRTALAAMALATIFLGTSCDRLGIGRPPHPPADQVVGEFLEAIRTGNDERASELLTPLARQRTEEKGVVVSPPGSDTASFKIVRCELVGQQAHVTADWTDLDDGRPNTYRIIWILRKWRPAGGSPEWLTNCLRTDSRSC